MKVGMGELYSVGIVVGAEKALLEGRYLAEAIEVELSDEGRKVLVLEPFPEDLAGESFLIEDWATVLVSECGSQLECLGHAP